jgi:phospholipid/cholesterol/gamma-HCH transport system permease protein
MKKLSKKTATNESVELTAFLELERSGRELLLNIAGDWSIGSRIPPVTDVENEIINGNTPGRIGFKTQDLHHWDSSLLTFLMELAGICLKKGVSIEMGGLPEGVQRLFSLASKVPERKGAHKKAERTSLLSQVGEKTIDAKKSALNGITFLGEVAWGFVRLMTGKARFRISDLWLFLQESGSQALPIVSLISLLVGLILAFVGAIQLKLFGAQIYVADLVGIAMIRAMGAIMTGIIMAGRTGASYAAQIGTMQVNEEIDALKTAGIPPIDYLVIPRVLALTIMMPLLTLYADLMGVIGGLIVGVTGLNLSPREFYTELEKAVPLINLWIGLFSGLVYGVLVSITGCMKGMQCGRSASAVGDATRSAVVSSIISIVVATAIITVICNIIGI